MNYKKNKLQFVFDFKYLIIIIKSLKVYIKNLKIDQIEMIGIS